MKFPPFSLPPRDRTFHIVVDSAFRIRAGSISLFTLPCARCFSSSPIYLCNPFKLVLGGVVGRARILQAKRAQDSGVALLDLWNCRCPSALLNHISTAGGAGRGSDTCWARQGRHSLLLTEPAFVRHR